MKKTPDDKSKPAPFEDMKPEYRFDYSKARPNRFAKGLDDKRVIEKEWVKESRQRLAEYDSGKAKGIPSGKVHDNVDECIQKARKEP